MAIKFNGSNPVVCKTGQNISLEWIINEGTQKSIDYIRIYDHKNELLAMLSETVVLITSLGKDHYNNRLKIQFVGKALILSIFNANYQDSGNYTVEVLSKAFVYSNSAITLNVHGKFLFHVYLRILAKSPGTSLFFKEY